MQGYDFTKDDFARLLIARFYPEKTDHESAVIRDFLQSHLGEYDRVSFSVRVGQGLAPDPTHLPGVQQSTTFSSRRRIDVVLWQGNAVTIVEAKKYVRHDVLGQLLSDRQLWLEEFPDGGDPTLIAIGRYSDDETLRILSAHGITVHLYEPATGP